MENDVRPWVGVWRNAFVGIEVESDGSWTSVLEDFRVRRLRQFVQSGDFGHEVVVIGAVCGRT